MELTYYVYKTGKFAWYDFTFCSCCEVAGYSQCSNTDEHAHISLHCVCLSVCL